MTAAASLTPSASFWDRIADRYARRPVADEAAYQAKIAETRSRLFPEAEVLEFGCGTGATAALHAPHVRRYVAADVAPRMIEIARERGEGIAGLEFRVTDFAGLEAEAASFDAILGLNVLHLMPDWEAAVAKAARLLKPGGVFVTSTACLAERLWWLRPVAWAGRAMGKLPEVRFFPETALHAAMEREGFEIEFRSVQKGPVVFLVARLKG